MAIYAPYRGPHDQQRFPFSVFERYYDAVVVLFAGDVGSVWCAAGAVAAAEQQWQHGVEDERKFVVGHQDAGFGEPAEHQFAAWVVAEPVGLEIFFESGLKPRSCAAGRGFLRSGDAGWRAQLKCRSAPPCSGGADRHDGLVERGD